MYVKIDYDTIINGYKMDLSNDIKCLQKQKQQQELKLLLQTYKKQQ